MFVYQRDLVSSSTTQSKPAFSSTSSMDPRPTSYDDVTVCVRFLLHVLKPTVAYVAESADDRKEEQGGSEEEEQGEF